MIAGDNDAFAALAHLIKPKHRGKVDKEIRVYPQDHPDVFGGKFPAQQLTIQDTLDGLCDSEIGVLGGVVKALGESKMDDKVKKKLFAELNEHVPAAAQALEDAKDDTGSEFARYYDEENRDDISHESTFLEDGSSNRPKCFFLPRKYCKRQVEAELAANGGCITAFFKTGVKGGMALAIVIQTTKLAAVDSVLKNRSSKASEEIESILLRSLVVDDALHAESVTTKRAAATVSISELQPFHTRNCFTVNGHATEMTSLSRLVEYLSEQHTAHPLQVPLLANLFSSKNSKTFLVGETQEGKVYTSVYTDISKANQDSDRKLQKARPGTYIIHQHAKPKDGSFELSLACGQQVIQHVSLIRTPEKLEIFPSQRRNGAKLYGMVKHIMLNTDLKDYFTSCECIIIVPPFDTLEEQTKERIRLANLYFDANVDSTVPRVRVFKAVKYGDANTDLAELKELIGRNPRTLFCVIQDECHFGLTIDGVIRRFLEAFSTDIGDPASNVVRICVSATADSHFILPTEDTHQRTFKSLAGDCLPVHFWDPGSTDDCEEAAHTNMYNQRRPLYYGEQVCIVFVEFA